MTATLFVSKTLLVPSRSQPREQLLEVEHLAMQLRAAGCRVERPIDVLAPDKRGHYELVDGHRRHAAALLIDEMQEVEVRVVAGTPAEIALRQLRANDGMPLNASEEAGAYLRLQREHELTTAQIADQVGRPIGYVRSRLLLAHLGDEARALFAEKRIGIAGAMLLAHLDEGVQADAADTLARLYPVGPISTLHVRHAIERHTHALVRAPFDPASESLHEAAGSCLTCSHNTATQRDLFEETDEAGICTSAGCWDNKVEANRDLITRQAEGIGARVMDASEVAKTLDAGRVRPGARWVHVDTPIDAESGDALTWRELEKQLAEADRDGEGYASEHLAVAFDAGRPVWLLDSEYAEQFIRKSYPKRAAQLRGEADPDVLAAKEAKREQKEKSAAEAEIDAAVTARFVEAMTSKTAPKTLQHFTLMALDFAGPAIAKAIAKRRELDDEDGVSPHERVARLISTIDDDRDLFALFGELLLATHLADPKLGTKVTDSLLGLYGIERKAVAKELKNAKRNVKSRGAKKGKGFV